VVAFLNKRSIDTQLKNPSVSTEQFNELVKLKKHYHILSIISAIATIVAVLAVIALTIFTGFGGVLGACLIGGLGVALSAYMIYCIKKDVDGLNNPPRRII
jgi:hypothetical protein